MASRFYSLAFVLITGIWGLVSSPDLPFVTAQAQTTQERKTEADRLLNLANQQYNTRKLDAALHLWQQALTIYQEIKDRRDEGIALRKLGRCSFDIHQYNQALDYGLKALAIAQEIKDRQSEETELSFLGLYYATFGKYEKAIAYRMQALAIAREIKNRHREIVSLYYLGYEYEKIRKYEKAIDYGLQYLAIAQEIKDRKAEVEGIKNLGRYYLALHQYDKTLDYELQSLAIAREIKDRNGEGRSLGDLSWVYGDLHQYDKALDYGLQSLAIMRELKNLDVEALGFANIGSLMEREKNPELAIVFYKQSIIARESLRKDRDINFSNLDQDLQNSYKKIFSDSYSRTYRHLADLLLKQGRIIEALQVLDLLKVQELDDYLKNVKGNDRTSQGVRLLESEKAFGDKLFTTSYEQIPLLNQKLSNQIQQLPKSETNKIPDYLQKLPQGAVLVYPLILGDRLELIVFSANTLPINRTVPIKQAALERLIQNFRLDIRDSSSLDVKASSKELYNLLVKPIEVDLKQANATTIFYAPDSILRYIPLAALYDGKQWLAEKYRIDNLIAYSLFDPDSKLHANPSIFAGSFGNSLKGNSEFAPLPATISEVESIKSLFPNTTELTGRDFTDKNTEAKILGNTIIHFATHAQFQSGSPQDSFILFGDGSKVTISEIDKWNLTKADLVVLSACQTGLGTSSNGAEILGFGYQVQKAGAKASIASLWTVSDGGTQLLMQAFYENLQKGNPSLSTSLREAQLSMIHRLVKNGEPNYNHPYFWSAFILIGNGL